MIPHTRNLPENAKCPAVSPVPSSGRSAELSCHERPDSSTAFFCFLARFCLYEHPNHGLRARWTHENTALLAQLGAHALDLAGDALRQLFCGNTHVRGGLWKAHHHGGRLLERPALERVAEQQSRGEAVARDVVAQVDDVT